MTTCFPPVRTPITAAPRNHSARLPQSGNPRHHLPHFVDHDVVEHQPGQHLRDVSSRLDGSLPKDRLGERGGNSGSL
jgi:hypothetical protein